MRSKACESAPHLILALTLLVALAPAARSQDRKFIAPTVALVGGKIYASPKAAPIEDGAVLLRDGKIAAVGTRKEVAVPKSAQVIDCTGKVITAGFWNGHIHLTEPAWNNAATAPVARLEQHMQEMLTRWGFVAVFDLGSVPDNSNALKRRIASGELAGPRIYMAGDIFPKKIPIYLSDMHGLPQADTPEEARKLAMGYMAAGDDAVKLFTGSYQGDAPVVNMPEPVAQAAVEVAHAHGKPVFTHPQNRVGEDNALAAGVDVLAHTIPSEGEYTKDELARMKAQHVALEPTLTLWEVVMKDAPAQARQHFVDAGVHELKSYFDEGGTIIFGTDVGFTQHYDTSDEYALMAQSGMTWSDILASLTTNPATFFKVARTGEVKVGNEADLVVLEGDPAKDVRNFADVAYTIRAGKVIYKK